MQILKGPKNLSTDTITNSSAPVEQDTLISHECLGTIQGRGEAPEHVDVDHKVPQHDEGLGGGYRLDPWRNGT